MDPLEPYLIHDQNVAFGVYRYVHIIYKGRYGGEGWGGTECKHRENSANLERKLLLERGD